MKTIYSIMFTVLITVLGIHAQTVTEIESEPYNVTFNYKCTKASFNMRGAYGVTIIKPEFFGELWEEDAKAAVKYACKLMEEVLPTSYPIVIKMSRDVTDPYTPFVRTATPLKKEYSSNFPTFYSEDVALPRALAKRRLVEGHTVSNDFYFSVFDEPDATIYFTPDDIFSTRLDGNVDDGKYDLVTVTLRELAKALAMNTTITAVKGVNNQLIHYTVDRGTNEKFMTPYTCALIYSSGQSFYNDPSSMYSYFTSGNVSITGPYNDRLSGSHQIYAPSRFDRNSSLLYFNEDINNEETLLLQPNLPKGTAIHKVPAVFRDILIATHWYDYNLSVGGGSEGIGNEMAPISQFMTIEKVYGAQTLNRFNLFNSIAVNGMAADGYSSGDAINAIKEVAEEVLPRGYGYEFGGITREESKSTNTTAIIYIVCILLTYLILAAMYESFFIPFAVILSIPFGILGSFLFAKLFGLENNIYLQTGMIMLIGLLSKTAILITEYAVVCRRNGMSLSQSAIAAAKNRLRPILMTALTMIFGLLPLMFSSGVGANGNSSLGTGAIGGMLIGTLALLFIVPSLFVIFEHVQERFKPISATSKASQKLIDSEKEEIEKFRTERKGKEKK